MKQTTFASLAWHGKGKVTRREQFLGEMNAVIKPLGPCDGGRAVRLGVDAPLCRHRAQ